MNWRKESVLNAMEDAIKEAMHHGWSWQDFVREAQDEWVRVLQEEAHFVSQWKEPA